MAYNNAHPVVIEAISRGEIQGIEELITDKIEIEDVVEKGFLALLDRGDGHSKRPIACQLGLELMTP